MKHALLTVLAFSALRLPAQQEISFREHFNDNSAGWETGDDKERSSSVKDGHYSFAHKKKNGGLFFWKSAVIDPDKDYIIEAKVMQADGVDDNGFGIVWGAADAQNYMQYVVSTNGYFKAGTSRKGSYLDIIAWAKTNKVNPKGSYNTLMIKKWGSTIDFYINGTQVGTAPAANLHGDLLGFVCYSKMSVKVDHIEVKQDGMQVQLVENAINGYKKENLGAKINSGLSELSPQVSPDGKTLYICRRDEYGKDDIFYSRLDAQGNWTAAMNAGTPLNNDGNNSVLTVCPDMNTLMVINTYNPDGSVKGSGVSMANRTRTGWEVPKEVEITDYYNRNKFNEYCLSPNRKVLLMTLERDEGYGDKDVYVTFEENGKFTRPLNLGKVVNTFASEVSPFLAADNVTLYYSTNGKPGYGDNDIFVTKRLDDTWTNWSEPKNLGPEINTDKFDAYYTIPASGEYAYVASYENSLGKSDIFRIKIPQSAKPGPVVIVSGKVLDKKTSKPVQARIVYTDLNGNLEMGTAISNPETGEYSIALPHGRQYGFMAMSVDGYFPISENIDARNIAQYGETKRDLFLNPVEVNETIALNNVFIELDKLLIQSYGELDRLIKLLKDHPAMKIEMSMGHKLILQYLYSKGIAKDRIIVKNTGSTAGKKIEFRIIAK